MDVIGIALSVLSAMLLYASLGILAPPAFRKICTQAASLPHPIDAHERVRIVEDNREALVVRLQMIGAAKRGIVLSTFKWLDGPASNGVAAALRTAGLSVSPRRSAACASASSSTTWHEQMPQTPHGLPPARLLSKRRGQALQLRKPVAALAL